ncbi:MAG: hypothetical protein J7K13_07140, partial [Thermoplasmata archaeon]|nr:hypothetical protein [Thermoplasmata archaeon]
KGIEDLERLNVKGKHSLSFQKDKYQIFFEIYKLSSEFPLITIYVFNTEDNVGLRIVRPAGAIPSHWEVIHDSDLLEKLSEKEIDEILKFVKEILDRAIPMLILKEL